MQRAYMLQEWRSLTFHYSNTWPDPGAQSIPTQWERDEMTLDGVRLFTKKVIEATEAEYADWQ